MSTVNISNYMAMYPCRKMDGVERWITCPVRLAFPNLAEPRAVQEGQEKKYSATLIFPRDADLSVLKEAAKQAAIATHGAGVNFKSLRSPFRDGSERAEYDGFDGCKFINVSTKYKPVIVDRNGDQIDATDPRIYPGMWVIAKLTCYGYKQLGNNGVSFGLVALQRLLDDEPFASSDPTAGFAIETSTASAAKPVPAQHAARHDAPTGRPVAAQPRAAAASSRPDDAELFPGMPQSNGAKAPAQTDW